MKLHVQWTGTDNKRWECGAQQAPFCPEGPSEIRSALQAQVRLQVNDPPYMLLLNSGWSEVSESCSCVSVAEIRVVTSRCIKKHWVWDK